MASNITLSASVRQNLLSLQSTAQMMSITQNRLATGKKVNSALDNPSNFFTSQSLNNRASDLNALLDSIGQAQQTLKAADTGITSLTKLVESAKSVAAGGEADPEAAKQAPVGARASRTNTLFSIPMLFFMGSARHLSLVRAEDPAYGPYLIAVLIIAALLEAGIFVANPLHKQLATVKGTLTSGFVTTLILFLIATTLL